MNASEENNPLNEENIDDVMKRKVSPARPYVLGPVAPEKHYDAFKKVEEQIRMQLSKVPHEYDLTALRVAYDAEDSSSEDDMLPHPVEFGEFGWVDLVLRRDDAVEINDLELRKFPADAPIPAALLDELYDVAKAELEKEAAEKVQVGITIVVKGSDPQVYAINCTCKEGRKKKRKIKTFGLFPGSPPRYYCGSDCS